MSKSIGYGVYGSGPFQPDFTVCKSEGGTANCPAEYVKEFGDLTDTWTYHKLCLFIALILGVSGYLWGKHRQKQLQAAKRKRNRRKK